MNEKIYNFEFWRWNFDCDNFKKKQATLIINMIKGSRLQSDMVFDSYGHIAFDNEDVCHKRPNISYLDDFNKSKTNCLIYNLNETVKNQGKYDKCFIYHSAGPTDGNYGYVFYNTETGEMMHKYFIDHEFDALCVKLNESFNSLFKAPIYDFFARKYDIIKGRIQGKDLSIKDEKDFWDNRNQTIEKYL